MPISNKWPNPSQRKSLIENCHCERMRGFSRGMPKHSLRTATRSTTFALLVIGVLVLLIWIAKEGNSTVSTRSALSMDLVAIQLPHDFSTRVRLCDRQTVPSLRKKGFTRSQQQEDVKALSWFNGLCGGTYLEMGAVDGLRFSNTYAFHKGFGWHGLLIEMAPPSYRDLVTNRPNDVTVNAAICDEPRTLHYWFNPDRKFTAGIWEFTQPEFRASYWPGVTIRDTTPVECAPLDTIIKEKFSNGGPQYFDFWSLDVEGAEMMVLKSVDFATTSFGMIVVEADGTNERKNLALKLFLDSNGYEYVQKEGNNYWFANRNFADIYGHVLHEGPATLE